jgi:hypothetical protein
MSRYKCWRSVRDKHIHLLCHEGSAAFDSLSPPIQELGPWQGSKEGAIADLRLPYRLLLAEQQFVIIHRHVSQLDRRRANCDCR